MNFHGSVRDWLESNGFERFVELFEENEIDDETLLELTDEHFKELGLPLGPRVKLLKAIAQLKQETGTAAVPPPGRAADPAHVADVPPSPAQPAAAAAAAARQAERRQLTVMFVDLVGSTAIAGRLDPEEMGGVIRGYQNAVAGEVARFDGHVAKFMGDGVLA